MLHCFKHCETHNGFKHISQKHKIYIFNRFVRLSNISLWLYHSCLFIISKNIIKTTLVLQSWWPQARFYVNKCWCASRCKSGVTATDQADCAFLFWYCFTFAYKHKLKGPVLFAHKNRPLLFGQLLLLTAHARNTLPSGQGDKGGRGHGGWAGWLGWAGAGWARLGGSGLVWAGLAGLG